MSHRPMDLDPLSTYDYPSYNSYPAYPHNVKSEQPISYQYNNTYIHNQQTTNQQPIINDQSNETAPNVNDSGSTNNDGKDDGRVVAGKRSDKKNGRSYYCSEKITDTNFAFYGCSVCDISYTTLLDLDQHVISHKDRMTSYRLRLKNQVKKKQLKKQQKKFKKLSKIKKETDPVLEIKPEDGYIGNETAGDYMNKDSDINGISPNLNVNRCVENTSQINGTVNNSQNNGVLNKENSNINNSSENSFKDNAVKDANELKNLEKIYKCFACKKQFTLSYYLKLHVRSHTDEKPYICNICGQSFITASKRGRHNKRIHLAERYQCRICFKIFSRFDSLTGHFDKNHPDDKLEGEPYDYNAILPYLKELEEQLKVQDQDVKPDPEGLLWDGDQPFVDAASVQQTTESVQPQSDDQNEPSVMGIIIEEIKVDPDDSNDGDVKVKTEMSDDEGHAGDDYPGDDHIRDDDTKNEPVKDESNSDEDYFPSKTWLSSPKMDLSPPSPPRRRRKSSSLVCEVCNKRVSSASYMRVHLRTHSGEKPFKCWHCGRGFITSSKMHRHVLTHEIDEEGKSESVGDKTASGDGEVTTGKNKNASKKKTKSKYSKANKNNEEKPKKKYQKRPHACEFCNQKFLHLDMLQVHRKSHEGEKLVLKCNFCLVEASDEASLKEHEATHTGPKPYLCTICGKCYKKKETMVYHKKHHKPDREFVCEICSKRFGAACKLHKHMRTHRAGGFVLRYECPVCAHMFNTKYHVQMHLATHQKEGLILEENRSDILAMVLQNARKIPKQPDAPANLTDIIPSDERSRICNICGEIFHHFYYLEEHLKNHGSRISIEDTQKDEEKKYICQICNKGFKLHYYLKLHTFTHSKEKPFMCQQCGKGFITKGKLKRHLETHTGLKKYQCHICCKFFTRPSYLRIHIRTIHGTQDYNFSFDKYSVNNLAMPVLTQISDGSPGSI